MKALLITSLSLPALVATVPLATKGMLVQRLGLDPMQQTAVQRVLEAHRPVLLAKADALRQTRRSMVDACLDPAISNTEFASLQPASSAAAQDLLLELHQVIREIDPLLRADQKAKARVMISEARSHLDALRNLAIGQ